jgi:hypothetical protein
MRIVMDYVRDYKGLSSYLHYTYITFLDRLDEVTI